MKGAGIAFYVVGALFALYLIAAAWRSKDAEYRNDVRRAASLHTPTVERRLIHWWRARRRLRSVQT